MQVETHGQKLEEITKLGPKLEDLESKLTVQDQMLSKCMEHFERGCSDAFALTTAEGTSWARPQRGVDPKNLTQPSLGGTFPKLDELMLPIQKAVQDLQRQSYQTEERLQALARQREKRPVSFTFQGRKHDKPKTIYV